MGLKIVRGIEPSATKDVLYGTEGIGKTTLASKFPNPIILDTEDGSRRIECAKVKCHDWKTLKGALIDLGGDAQGFKTVVIDSIDWAEQLIVNHLEVANGKHPDDMPYGRGAGLIAAEMSAMLKLANVIVSRGVHVLLVGHSTVKRCSPPDMEEGFDRFELKLRPKTAPLVKEWADCILFANYKTRVVEGGDGKNRGKGGKDRVLYTERCAAWDAKNRYGMKPDIPMTIEALAALFDGTPVVADAPTRTKPKSWRERIADCETLDALGDIGNRVDEAESAGKLTPDQADELRAAINARHNVIEPQEVTDGVA